MEGRPAEVGEQRAEGETAGDARGVAAPAGLAEREVQRRPERRRKGDRLEKGAAHAGLPRARSVCATWSTDTKR